MTVQGQDDLQSPNQHQKWIPQIIFSHSSGITHVYTPKNNKSLIFIMADGGHFGFGHSEIRGRVAGKHLGDF